MSGSTDIRVIDLPDLGNVTDTSSVVADKSGTGRFSALAIKNYCFTASIPEAPSTNSPYGRMNGAWTPVLPDAPANNVSYGRLNASWSPVVPEAPVTGAAYGRMNGAWTGVLPITGGAISGGLSTSSDVTVGGGVFAYQFSLSPANGYSWAFYVQPGTGNHIQQHLANYYDSWEATGGKRGWYSPAGAIMSLDGAGNLVTAGNVSATQMWCGTPSQFGFTPGGTGRIFQFTPGFYLDFNTSNAALSWTVSNGPLWVMRAADDFCYNPLSSVGGNGAYLNTSDRRAKANIAPTSKGLAEVLQLQPVEFDRVNPATGAQTEIGFVAQDVQPIVPEAVWTAGIPLRDGSGGLDSADPTLALSESTITALNVNAIKELNALITGLRDRIASLEAAA